MSDTIGSLIDKLFTVDMKMWTNQDELFKVRKMTFEEFKQEYLAEENFKRLWISLKNGCDLNVQRNDIIDEIDEKLIEILESTDKHKFVQKKYKTY